MIDQTQSPWLLELVAGLANEGEKIADVAVREVFEESGIKLEDHEIIADYFNSPGISDERTTIFCGKVDSKKAGGIFGVDNENEDICVEVLSLDTAFKFLISGEINNAMTIIALQWLALNKKELLVRWA
jgi:ADP-ribose pyrophosphatase